MYTARRKSSHPTKWNFLQMKPFSFRLSLSTPFIAALLALLSLSAITSPAEAQSASARRIEAYYQQLTPTLKAAGSLSVGERDRRFGPAIRSAFDIGTMARMA